MTALGLPWQPANDKSIRKGWYIVKAGKLQRSCGGLTTFTFKFTEGRYAVRMWNGRSWKWLPPECKTDRVKPACVAATDFVFDRVFQSRLEALRFLDAKKAKRKVE